MESREHRAAVAGSEADLSPMGDLVETTKSLPSALLERYYQVRQSTEDLAGPLSAEDQQVQSMADVSPTKWHRAHTTWFFETFVLGPYADWYTTFDPAFGYLFNSYYESVGARHPRPERGLVTRPSVSEVAEYRRHVDAAMERFTAALDSHPAATELGDLIELGLHHEQQHQELLLMDIKHVLSVNPLQPTYQPGPAVVSGDPTPMGWVGSDGGIVEIGHCGDHFAFDNEEPRHEVLLAEFEISDRLVTCGEWLDFMADGAYRNPLLWLSDGWHRAQEEGWTSPSYWFAIDGEWQVQTLAGPRPIDPAEPVSHVSYYEADAYASWVGARLPLETEWEHVAAHAPVKGNFAGTGLFHPRPASASDGTVRQLYGDLWEWTASPYTSYPGFVAAPGAVGEYNGKFMVNQMVLRGGSCATPEGHVRPTYRNFFPPHSRWMFSGLRLARWPQ
jgi:ergothioneine biosynthesis protein EgtB